MKQGKFSVVIVAAGSSNRYGKEDKLAEVFFDKTVLQHTVDVFLGLTDEIIVVGDYEIAGAKRAKGGNTRFASVKNGLAAVSPDVDVVAIHDGARPFVSRALAQKLLDCAFRTRHSAVPYTKSVDAVWSVEKEVRPLNKEALVCVQTPQCFDYKKLLDAFQSANSSDYPDESALFYEKYGAVNLVEGEVTNRKITFWGDVPEYKTGVGFDVHAFMQGNGVILGGVTIPFDKKLQGHSDADVLAHAICDAVLSASGNKDIGHQFPDTDARYKGANSMELLRQCVALAKSSGYEVLNVSAVVICQLPKLAPYLDEITANLSRVLNVSQGCVNLTATTTERLGALGNGDGIAAQAVSLLKKTGF